MATQTTPCALVTWDKPIADGRIMAFGMQQDYQFAPPTENAAFGGQQYYWPLYSNAEYLPALQCVRPEGNAFLTDMAIAEGQWAVEHGKWRTTKPGLRAGRTAFLDYYDTSPDAYGSVLHEQNHWPNMAALVIRNTPAANGTTWGNYIAFEFLGNPLLTTHKKFAFIFPVGDSTYKYPVLTMDAVGSGTYTTVAAWNHGAASAHSANGIEVDEFWFEWIDGGWHVRRSGVEQAFIYRPADGDAAFSPGYVRCYVYGHACMVWFGDITYATTATVTQSRYTYVNDAVFSGTRAWHVHSWRPDTNWTVTPSEETNPANADEFRPVLTIAQGTGDPHKPPAVFVTSFVAEAAQGGNSSAPTNLDHDNGYWVDAITYDLDQTGRGQTCQITLNDRSGVLPWKGNEKITAKLGWNKDDGSGTTTQKFLGYVQRLPREGDDQKDNLGPNLSIGVGDPIDARLSKKCMVCKSAAGGEDLPTWVYRILYDAGAPAAQLTAIYAMIGTGPTIPLGQPKGDLRYKFSADVCVIDALDDVCAACGREWGWNAETGLYFLRVPVTYSGTPDWTLDDDTATAADFVWNLTHESSPEEYRNVLYAISETLGEQWSMIYLDNESRITPTDPSYIGDDWWEVITETDAPDGTGKALKRWLELIKQHSLIGWTMRGRTDLGPGKFVKMQVTKMGVTTDAIYQIIHEHGEMTWGEADPKFSVTLTARIWETS
jgi:hypothetical protein